MTSIPHEIWVHIAQFIPALVLQDLYTLNSVFFEIAMDCRYRQMSFAYLDKRMLRSLARLKDPAVAKRVRILHVYPGFLKEALDREKTGHVKPIYLRRSLRDKLAELANLKMFLKHPKMRFIRTFQRAEDVVQVMLEVLSGLPNVTDYYVTWCGLPSISVSAAPFLSTVFQSNLRKLSLELSLENVKNLLTPSFQVQNLQELKLCIHSETIGSKFERNEIMQTHLGPAISRLRNTLQILTIQSWEAADLSPMLRAIVYLPLLEQLVIAIPVESIHLGDPDGLSNFLHTHRTTLRILRLRATQFGGPGLTPNLVSFDNWVRAAVCGVNLPKLHVLDISSSLFPVYTSVTCLAHFSSTITSLSLTGCHRTYDDVEEAISLVSSHTRDEALSTLRIGLVSLSPQLVDLISTKLSGLFKLELVVRYILPHARDTPEFHLKTPSLVQGISQIDKFLSEMDHRTYPHWGLVHMSVLAEFLPNRGHYEGLLEQAFLRAVPSIKTFT